MLSMLVLAFFTALLLAGSDPLAAVTGTVLLTYTTVAVNDKTALLYNSERGTRGRSFTVFIPLCIDKLPLKIVVAPSRGRYHSRGL